MIEIWTKREKAGNIQKMNSCFSFHRCWLIFWANDHKHRINPTLSSISVILDHPRIFINGGHSGLDQTSSFHRCCLTTWVFTIFFVFIPDNLYRLSIISDTKHWIQQFQITKFPGYINTGQFLCKVFNFIFLLHWFCYIELLLASILSIYFTFRICSRIFSSLHILCRNSTVCSWSHQVIVLDCNSDDWITSRFCIAGV